MSCLIGSSCLSCRRYTPVTAATVSDNTLILTIPANNYENNSLHCLAIINTLPSSTTPIPVKIQISTGSTLYPLRTRAGHNIYSDQLRKGHIYMSRVATDTGTTGSFVYTGNSCLPSTSYIELSSIPETQITTQSSTPSTPSKPSNSEVSNDD